MKIDFRRGYPEVVLFSQLILRSVRRCGRENQGKNRKKKSESCVSGEAIRLLIYLS